MANEFDNYPPVQPKPKINWQKVWEKLASGFGKVAGWASVWAVVAAMVFGIAVGAKSCTASAQAYESWKYECMAAGNTVAVVSGPDLCLSGARIERPMDGWRLNTIECAKMGGNEGMLSDNTTVCYIGKIESREP